MMKAVLVFLSVWLHLSVSRPIAFVVPAGSLKSSTTITVSHNKPFTYSTVTTTTIINTSNEGNVNHPLLQLSASAKMNAEEESNNKNPLRRSRFRKLRLRLISAAMAVLVWYKGYDLSTKPQLAHAAAAAAANTATTTAPAKMGLLSRFKKTPVVKEVTETITKTTTKDGFPATQKKNSIIEPSHNTVRFMTGTGVVLATTAVGVNKVRQQRTKDSNTDDDDDDNDTSNVEVNAENDVEIKKEEILEKIETAVADANKTSTVVTIDDALLTEGKTKTENTNNSDDEKASIVEIEKIEPAHKDAPPAIVAEKKQHNVVEDTKKHNVMDEKPRNGKKEVDEGTPVAEVEKPNSLDLSVAKERIKSIFQKTSPPNPEEALMEQETAAATTTTTATAVMEKAKSVVLEKVTSPPSSLSLRSFYNPPTTQAKIAQARKQPKSPAEEARLQAKYAAIESLEERAFQILVDLGMVEIHTSEWQ